MSDPNPPLSSHLYDDFFRRQSWPEQWDPSEFSPEKWRRKVYNRIRSKPESSRSLVERFLDYTMCSGYYWPWGFFIYRTAYGSDEDWNQALAKLYRHIHHSVRSFTTGSDDDGDPEQIKDELDAADVVAEGCRNVVVEDKEILEGASPAWVRRLFNEWLERNPEYNDYGSPRSTVCLMIDDHAVQSILASPEPDGDLKQPPGYTIFVHRDFPDKGG